MKKILFTTFIVVLVMLMSPNTFGQEAKEVNIELFSRLQVKSGKITSSLYQDAMDAGIPPAIIMEFIRFYSFKSIF